MKAYQIALKSPTLFLSLTGLSPDQFYELLPIFINYLPPDATTGRNHTLSTPEAKLFFILFYYKHYPTQWLAAFLFQVDQSQISRWINWLGTALTSATNNSITKARKRISSYDDLLDNCPEVSIVIDATEQYTQRPTINQKKLYSGKKKAHTIKRQICVNAETSEIVDVSPTFVGRVHDFKICKKTPFINDLPKQINLLVDLGYQGLDKHKPDNKVFMPNKATKNFPLTEAQKWQNKLISSKRVIGEHPFAVMKSFHILKNKFRGSSLLANTAFEAIAGLHNFRLEH
jgi:IS5 family transposase